MALLYIGICKECNEEKELYDIDAVGTGGWQDTSRNGICGDCCDKMDKEHNEEIDAMEIDERLCQIEKHLKIRK